MMPKPKPEPGTTADLRERALRLLARREHSRFELSRKLEAAGFTRNDIGLTLDDFEARNWLSDQRFAESYVADHKAKAGSIKLAYELRQRGVSETVTESVLAELQDSELYRACDVWNKKFGTPPADAAEKAKQIRFLQSRGFTLDVAYRAITTSSQQVANLIV